MPKSGKGGGFERLIADQLSAWWTGEEDWRVLWRTSNSGGMATVRGKKGKKANLHCGDLCAIDPIAEPLTRVITFELKRGYSKTTIHDLLDKPERSAKQVWESWIEQASAARKQSGSYSWAIISRRDKRNALITLPRKFAAVLFQEQEDCTLPFGLDVYPLLGMQAQVKAVGIVSTVTTTLSNFLLWVKPQQIKALAEQC